MFFVMPSGEFNILFVCTGNVCRSPMAAASLTARIPNALMNCIKVGSAGVHTVTGLPATVEAELAARMNGYSIGSHRSRPVSEVLLESADIVLCMEPYHTENLKRQFPEYRERIHTLKAFVGDGEEEIPDPFRQDMCVYQETLALIDNVLDRAAVTIWKLARKKKKSA